MFRHVKKISKFSQIIFIQRRTQKTDSLETRIGGVT